MNKLTIPIIAIILIGLTLFLALKPTPTEKCGDEKCGPKEEANPALCPEDCPQPTDNCGNGTCDESESHETCREDCPVSVDSDNSLDADGVLWGTETVYYLDGEPNDMPEKIDAINNHLKTKQVKMRLFVHNVYDYSTGEFKPIVCGPSQAQCKDSHSLDDFVQVFKENGWSMHPMLSPDTMKGVLSDADMDIYVDFVEWFVDRYKDEANIKYIELVNNPEQPSGRGWENTPEELVKTTNKIYDRIKAKYPDIMIGTPGFEYLRDYGVEYEKVEAYLDKSNNAKFDYWAFHGYVLQDVAPLPRVTVTTYPPTKTPENTDYAGITGILEIRKKLNENGWQDREIIDTEHTFGESAPTIQELVLKRTLKDENDKFVLSGIIPLKIVARTQGTGRESDLGSLNPDGSISEVVKSVAFLWSKLNEYKHDSHVSGTWDAEDEVWIEKFKTGNKELYIFFKPFEYNEGKGLKLDGKTLTYKLNLNRNPSSVVLIDIEGNETSLTPSQTITLEAENSPQYLEVEYNE